MSTLRPSRIILWSSAMNKVGFDREMCDLATGLP
jgi:hypothetical protein